MSECWNGFCIASECDGVRHVDATGYSWAEGRRPMPGDAVRIADGAMWEWGSWDRHIADRSAIGIIQGRIGDKLEGASVVFNHSTFRDDECVCSSGGPATIHTEFSELMSSGETVEVNVWQWRQGCLPGAGMGEPYTVTVPLWHWRPTS